MKLDVHVETAVRLSDKGTTEGPILVLLERALPECNCASNTTQTITCRAGR